MELNKLNEQEAKRDWTEWRKKVNARFLEVEARLDKVEPKISEHKEPSTDDKSIKNAIQNIFDSVKQIVIDAAKLEYRSPKLNHLISMFGDFAIGSIQLCDLIEASIAYNFDTCVYIKNDYKLKENVKQFFALTTEYISIDVDGKVKTQSSGVPLFGHDILHSLESSDEEPDLIGYSSTSPQRETAKRLIEVEKQVVMAGEEVIRRGHEYADPYYKLEQIVLQLNQARNDMRQSLNHLSKG